MIGSEAWFGVVLGFLVALLFEKYYVERASVLPNVVFIFFLMWPNWSQINVYIQWYVLIGIAIGIFALGFKIKRKRISWEMYALTYPFYCGKTLMPIYTMIVLFKEYFPTQLYTPYFWIPTATLLFVTWFVGVKYCNNNYPFQPFFK